MRAKLKFECGDCGDLHDDEDEARECCQPSVTEVWLCGECGDQHHEESAAINCCGVDPDEPYAGLLVIPPKKFSRNPRLYIQQFHELNGLIP